MARRAYRLTPKRRAALRKAQAASARARRGAGKASRNKKVRRAAVIGGVLGVAAGGAVARHKLSGSSFGVKDGTLRDTAGKRLGGTGLTSTKHNGGRVTKYRYRGKKRDIQVHYTHNPIKPGVAGRKIARGVVSPLKNSPYAVKTGYKARQKFREAQLSFGKDRHPEIPFYDGRKLGNYGSAGKRLANLTRFEKFRGGKKVSQAAGKQRHIGGFD